MSQEPAKFSRKLPPLNLQHVTDEEGDGGGTTPKKRKKRVVEGGELSPGRRSRSSSRGRWSDEDVVGGKDREDRKNGKKPVARDRSTSRSPAQVPSVKTENPVKKKVAKKKATGTSREALMAAQGYENGEYDDEPSPQGRKKKKKKKGKVAMSDTEEGDIGLASYLSGMKDDVVEAESGEDLNDAVAWTTPAMRSEPNNRVFIEKKSGFKSTDKAKLARRQLEQIARQEENNRVQSTETTIQLALTSHRVFKTFSLFCHGLLAGFALWHIITVFSLSGHDGGFADFLVYYQPLALPVQALYYLLLVLCTVSVMDRYDIGRPNRRFIIRALTMQSGAVSVLVYVAALLFSVSVASTDDKIGLYKDQPGLWEDEHERDQELNTWRVLNLCRGVGSILGWVIVSLRPNTDRLTKNLEKSDENIIDISPPVEMQHTNGV